MEGTKGTHTSESVWVVSPLFSPNERNEIFTSPDHRSEAEKEKKTDAADTPTTTDWAESCAGGEIPRVVRCARIRARRIADGTFTTPASVDDANRVHSREITHDVPPAAPQIPTAPSHSLPPVTLRLSGSNSPPRAYLGLRFEQALATAAEDEGVAHGVKVLVVVRVHRGVGGAGKRREDRSRGECGGGDERGKLRHLLCVRRMGG